MILAASQSDLAEVLGDISKLSAAIAVILILSVVFDRRKRASEANESELTGEESADELIRSRAILEERYKKKELNKAEYRRRLDVILEQQRLQQSNDS